MGEHVASADYSARHLSVLENAFLGHPGWRRRDQALERHYDEIAEKIGYFVDAHTLVGDLSIGERQMVSGEGSAGHRTPHSTNGRAPIRHLPRNLPAKSAPRVSRVRRLTPARTCSGG